ncbi:hypothetical protein B9Z19DRAFT_1131463 [Tuber borchii]|uniref:CDR ABC transporter domain-containing protein n=1 Tax=Tuber borchii TaxID=42251 RepID=A0A2T6ZIT0_TUBBO|nr:hypothetical protein B9Z19DRAFT_1131463 [Tuber borchii]
MTFRNFFLSGISQSALPAHEFLHLYFIRKVLFSLGRRVGGEQTGNMVVYFMPGMSPTHTSQFLISLLVVFLITANMYCFRMVGVFSANLDVAIHITGVSIQALILGTRIVRGEDYIHTQFTYLWSHLWRNVGIIIAFWMFFAIMIAVDFRLRSRTAGVLEVIGGGPGHDGPTPPTTGNEPEADRAPKEFVVMVPYAGIPNLWRFVYWISPFKYLVSGFTGVLVHDVPVRCSKNELAKFNLPPNVANCAEYTADFVKRLGGYVEEENGV